MLKNLLIWRLILLNAAGAVLLIWAGWLGFISILIAGDATKIIFIIATIFLLGLASIFSRAKKVNDSLNAMARGKNPDVDPTKFLEKAAHIDDIPEYLTVLGLLGTMIGLAISIEGFSGMTNFDVESIKSLVIGLTSGLKTAFYTSIVGVVLAFWLLINRRILKTTTVLMLEDVKKLDK